MNKAFYSITPVLLILFVLVENSANAYDLTFPEFLYRYDVHFVRHEKLNLSVLDRSSLEYLTEEEHDNYVSFTNSYNNYLCREVNGAMQELYDYVENDHFSLDYERDLEETNYGGIRFVVRNNLTPLKLTDLVKNNNPDDILNKVEYYIYDLETNQKFKSHTNIMDFMQMINYYYSYYDAYPSYSTSSYSPVETDQRILSLYESAKRSTKRGNSKGHKVWKIIGLSIGGFYLVGGIASLIILLFA